MEDLIKALQIFLKYGNPSAPTHCEHDIMYICGIDHNTVTDEDKAKLDELGFYFNEYENCFTSYRFGSA